MTFGFLSHKRNAAAMPEDQTIEASLARLGRHGRVHMAVAELSTGPCANVRVEMRNATVGCFAEGRTPAAALISALGNLEAMLK